MLARLSRDGRGETVAYVSTGLFNDGQTRYFQVLYDDSLAASRGVDLASDLMKYCDGDFTWLNAFFPGVTPGTPINVYVADASSAADIGGGWTGWGLIPLQVTLSMGEIPVTGGDPLTLARYLLVAETSEIFMRQRQPAFFNRYNDWFEAFDEGSKGESLSRVMGIQLLRDNIPQVTMIPAAPGVSFGVTSIWLNGIRDNRIEVDIDDIDPDDITGCGTLFLLFLHDQLGFGWADIIAAGGATLSDVYSHLTGDDRANAFTVFSDLVNLHYPQGGGLQYFPRLDTVFPVPNLRTLVAPSQVSWVSNGPPGEVQVTLDQVTTVVTTVMLSSSDPATADVASQVAFPIGSALASTGLQVPVPGDAEAFTDQAITITADYAGESLTCQILVVRPEELVLPALEIDVVTADDPCQQPFAEGSALLLGIKNLDVIASHEGLRYQWTVAAAAPAADDTPQLSIPALPAAGTKVTVDVVVTNELMIHAQGHFEFTVAGQLPALEELERLVRCRLSGIRQVNVIVPPWIPVEAGPLQEEHLTIVEERSVTIARELRQTVSLIQQLRRARESEQPRTRQGSA
jgi:hypothetical protein